MSDDSAALAMPSEMPLSLCRLLDPRVLADPYPLYRSLRERDRVEWDPYLHAWVVTGYAEAVTVLQRFSAARTPTPEQLVAMGMPELEPMARVMVKQMLFMDGATHARLRGLCASAFTSRRVAELQAKIQQIADELLDRVIDHGEMDVIRDFANPLPAIVTAELLGVPRSDHRRLKAWSADFAEVLGNLQHNPDRAARMVQSLHDMTDYFAGVIRERRQRPRAGLIADLLDAEVDGARLGEDEVIANTIVTMVGGQETTTNLIGNGLLTLLRNPDQMLLLRDRPGIMKTAIEELLRYESPSQHTARITPADISLGGKTLHKGDAAIAVMAAANRDPRQFPDPDRLDLTRSENRHLAFGWAAHFCFGAPLARLEAQVAFQTLLSRLPELEPEPAPLAWRENLGLRGLKALPVRFAPGAAHTAPKAAEP